MRELTRILVVVGLLAGLCAAVTVSGYAQGSTESSENPTLAVTPVTVLTPMAVTLPEGNIDEQELFTFLQMGSGELDMHGPYDWSGFALGLPAHWQLTEGSQIQLDVFAAFSYMAVSGTATQPTFTSTHYPLYANLDVYFNDILLASIPIDWTGERTVVIPITTPALTSDLPTGEHVLSLWLDAPFECEPGIQPHLSLAIRSSSSLLLKHDIVSPPVDLRRLPYPIYYPSFLPPDKAIMVVPDEPTADELRAALSVSAGLGQMTAGDLKLALIPVGQLKPAVQGSHHLIFVGKPEAFPMLGEVSLPAGASAADFQSAGASPGDGVIQMKRQSRLLRL